MPSEALDRYTPKPEQTALEIMKPGKAIRPSSFGPTNLTEAIAFSKLIADSDLAPRDFKGKPANVLIAIQMGAEVGLAPMQALQNIAVINGRPCLWGDAALAVVQVHPGYEWHKESLEGSGDDRTAIFQVKRRGQEVHETRFGVTQAKLAHLWGKEGPWKTYPDRMLQVRARGFGLRDKFSDALKGLILAEEAADLPLDDGMRDLIGQDTQLAEKSQSRLNEVKARYAEPEVTKEPEPAKEPIKSEPDSARAETEPPKSMETIEVTVLKIDPKLKAITAKQREENKSRREDAQHEPTPYYILKCSDDQSLFVWDSHLFPVIVRSQKKKLVGRVSKNDKGYVTLEEIDSLEGIKFARDEQTREVTPVEHSKLVQQAEENLKAGKPLMAPLAFEMTGEVTSFRTGTTGSGAPFVGVTLGNMTDDNKADPHQTFLCFKPELFEVLKLSEMEQIKFAYSKKVDSKGVVWQAIENVKQVGERKFKDGRPA